MIADRLRAADELGIDRADDANCAISLLAKALAESIYKFPRCVEADLHFASPGVSLAPKPLAEGEISNWPGLIARLLPDPAGAARGFEIDSEVADAVIADVTVSGAARQDGDDKAPRQE